MGRRQVFDLAHQNLAEGRTPAYLKLQIYLKPVEQQSKSKVSTLQLFYLQALVHALHF